MYFDRSGAMYYSGSPRLTGAVNVVSFSNESGVQVTRK